MKKISKAYIWVFAVLLTGVLIGGGLAYLGLKSGEAFVGPGEERAEKGKRWPTPEQILRHLSEDLDLTEEQQVQLLRILEHSRAEYQRVNREEEEQKSAVRRATMEQIRQILTPEQAILFEEHLKRRKESQKRESEDRH